MVNVLGGFVPGQIRRFKSANFETVESGEKVKVREV